MTKEPHNKSGERKSRRSHKNSRDGCPNCKAKRIKCSEELPSCHNCIKKNYQCGYLEFPKEKLDRIRKKNEKKTHGHLKDSAYYNQQPYTNEETKPSSINKITKTNGTDIKLNNNITENHETINATTPINLFIKSEDSDDSRIQKQLSMKSDADLKQATINYYDPAYQNSSYLQYYSPTVRNQYNNSYFNSSPQGNTFQYRQSPQPIPAPVPCQLPQISNHNSPQSVTPKRLASFVGSPPSNIQMESVHHLNRNNSHNSNYSVSSNFSNFSNTTTTNDTLTQEISNDEYLIERRTSNPHDIFASVSPVTSSLLDPDFFSTKEDLRGALYKDSFLKLANNESYNLLDYDFDDKKQPTGEEIDYHLGSSNSSDDDHSSFENSKINYIRHINSLNPNNFEHPSNHDAISSSANYLPNAIMRSQKFKRLSNPHNPLITKYKAFQNHELSTLVGLDEVYYLPIWSKDYAKYFWTLIFNQAVVVDVYWAFFMDRSLNIILKACDSMLQWQGNENSKIADSENATLFIKSDLEVLTRKSYNYYGKLIRKLRHAITHVHIEYPTKISLYAAWSCFIHSYATVDTLSLMYNGTSSLLTKIATEAKTVDDVTPTIRLCIQTLNYDCMVSVVPDYDFRIIPELLTDLLDFKQFIINNKSLTSLKNENTIRQFVQLETFLHDLINKEYPKIQYINKFYKASHEQDSGSDNIEFLSPSMFFNLLVNWFNAFANESLSVGSNISATKRTFYLFCTAIGKALSQVFTPMQSVLLVEPVNILAPQVDFDANVFKFDKSKLTQRQYEYLFKLSTKLIRIVKYFEMRSQILAYYYAMHTFWDKQECTSYLECFKAEHDKKSVSNADIIRIIPSKIDTNEEMLIEFDENRAINMSNFPMLDKLASSFHDEEAKTTYLQQIQKAKARQTYFLGQKRDGKSLEELFDYNTGLFNYDFNPQEAIKTYFDNRGINFRKLQDTTLEDIRLRITNIDISRRQVSKAIHNNFDNTNT